MKKDHAIASLIGAGMSAVYAMAAERKDLFLQLFTGDNAKQYAASLIKSKKTPTWVQKAIKVVGEDGAFNSVHEGVTAALSNLTLKEAADEAVKLALETSQCDHPGCRPN